MDPSQRVEIGFRDGTALVRGTQPLDLTLTDVSINLPLVNAYGVILAALADPTRRAVFEMLREGPRTVGDLAKALPVSRPAVSQHLSVLRDARLVLVEAHGTRRYYRIDPSGLEPLRRYLENFWDDVLTAFRQAATPSKGGSHDRHDPRD
jgi:DNA-binding transcriptional ArsR family regulator